VATESLVLTGKPALRFIGEHVNGLNCGARHRGPDRSAGAVDREWISPCEGLELGREAVIGCSPAGRHQSYTTKNLGDKVEIRIRDNGTGIPEEVREKIFNPTRVYFMSKVLMGNRSLAGGGTPVPAGRSLADHSC
jgi:hypothetical protein